MTGLLLGLVLSVGARPNLDPEGQFTYVLNGEIVAQEDFTFAAREDGNYELNSVFLLLSDEFLLEFETDRLFDQTLVLTPELALVSYTLVSDTVRGRLELEVTVEGEVATLTFSTTDEEGQTRTGTTDVILEDNVVASGVSGSGAQLSVLLQLLLQRGIDEPTTLLAFNPTSLSQPLIEVDVAPLPAVEVTAGGESFSAQRFSVSQLLQGEEGEPFTVELLAREGRLIGYRAFSATSTLLVYRSDLFPEGLQVEGGS